MLENKENDCRSINRGLTPSEARLASQKRVLLSRFQTDLIEPGCPQTLSGYCQRLASKSTLRGSLARPTKPSLHIDVAAPTHSSISTVPGTRTNAESRDQIVDSLWERIRTSRCHNQSVVHVATHVTEPSKPSVQVGDEKEKELMQSIAGINIMLTSRNARITNGRNNSLSRGNTRTSYSRSVTSVPSTQKSQTQSRPRGESNLQVPAKNQNKKKLTLTATMTTTARRRGESSRIPVVERLMIMEKL